MPEIYEGPDALRIHLTGAADEGLAQYDHALSLGGARSLARVSCLTTHEYSAFPGVKLRFVEARNGIGVGRLRATGPNSLKWAAPGDDYGTAVDIANGQRKALRSDTASKFIIIDRTSALPLAGVANVQLIDTANNLVGMSNFTEAQSTAGAAKFRACILKNWGADSITDCVVWVDETLDTRLAIGTEAVVSGAIQTVADEDTAPGGVSFTTPTEASPLSIGTIAAGDMIGLWIERFVATGANAAGTVRASVRLRFTYQGQTYETDLRGIGRIAEAGIAGNLFWWGHGAEPDWQNAAADEFSATSPVELTEVLTEGRHYLVTRKRNAHGIVGPPKQPFDVFDVAADLTIGYARPSAPSLVQVARWGAGGYRVDAVYMPEFDDIGYRATHWLIYATNDGTDPDPDVDTPTVVPMGYANLYPVNGMVQLNEIVETSELEDSPIRVIVRTRRAEQVWLEQTIPAADSDNTDVHETALEYCGPRRPNGIARYRDGIGIYVSPPAGPNEIVQIDEPNLIYWERLPGQTRLWAGGALVWNIKYDSGSTHNGVFTPLMHDATDIAVSAGTDPIEVLSWTVGDKRIGINVNGTRRMLIDVTNGRIQNAMWTIEDEPSGACQDVAIWPKYAHTCLMVWDPALQASVSVASIDSQGRVFSKVGFFTALTEAECL